jgi:hypothetical protein
MTECSIIIDTILLLESLGHQMSFVASNNRSIMIMLEFKNPFRFNNIEASSWRNKVPHLIFEKCIKFIMHSLSLEGMFHSSDMR